MKASITLGYSREYRECQAIRLSNGKRRQKMVTFLKQQEAEQKLAEYVAWKYGEKARQA